MLPRANTVSITIPDLPNPLLIYNADPVNPGNYTGVDANNLGVAKSLEVYIDYYFKPLQAATQSAAYDNLTLQSAQKVLDDIDKWPTSGTIPQDDVAALFNAGIGAPAGSSWQLSIQNDITYSQHNPFGPPTSHFNLTADVDVSLSQVKNVPDDYPSQAGLVDKTVYRRSDGTYFYALVGMGAPNSTPPYPTAVYEAPMSLKMIDGANIGVGSNAFSATSQLTTNQATPTVVAYWKKQAQSTIDTITQNSTSKQNYLLSMMTGDKQMFDLANMLIKRGTSTKSNMIAQWRSR